ncbi:hypothetical protein LXA43DRAFT_359480 [Ganoderma leucocontextum]|nr:hypothetical protein LXA43DRAFT_359480 [Ganoderma leucocontextum]
MVGRLLTLYLPITSPLYVSATNHSESPAFQCIAIFPPYNDIEYYILCTRLSPSMRIHQSMTTVLAPDFELVCVS